MKILGIDLGSREVKYALMDDGKIIHEHMVSTMTFYREYCSYDGSIVVDLEKLQLQDIDYGISTGYGRNNTDLSHFHPINEVKAHVYGAIYQSGMQDFILLDIGGQDVKAVQVEQGMIVDLELNEKCAASCGRYLENMAGILEVSLEEMSGYDENPVVLSSTCAVFSESELIARIAEGIPVKQLCASVNYSLYRRLRPLLEKFQGNVLILSGGVARNRAIQKYLARDYEQIIVLDKPQQNGALGCCYYGQKMQGFWNERENYVHIKNQCEF